MQTSQFFVLFAQLLPLILGIAAYLRQRQKGDIQGQEVARWAPLIDEAKRIASEARDYVDKIDVDHYRAMKKKYEELALEFDTLKRAFTALEERYERLKLDKAAEAKAAQRAAKVAADPWKAPAEGKEQPGEVVESLDDIIRRNGIPLRELNGAQPQTPARPGFGASAI